MTLDLPRPDWSRTAANISIERATTATTIDTFSDIQCRGFSESDAAYAVWHGWLHDANQRNAGNPNQSFYVGTLDGEPAGVTLAVRTGDVVGLYAIATKPNFRRRGVSAALMARAIDDAVAAGAKVVTLQTVTGSYAEGFYKRLGFRVEFIVEAFGK
jgi:GNAT superfamily N-acetyltransferase